MRAEEFRAFLKRNRRSPSAIQRCLTYVGTFEHYLQDHQAGCGLDDAGPEELEAFVAWLEGEGGTSAKGHLWAIALYYTCTADEGMRGVSAALREERIERRPFPLGGFRGVDADHVERLARVGIRNAQQMLEAGRTPADRQRLAEEIGVPEEAILELVQLSDLARIPGVKGIRARLYVDAGVETVEKMAGWDPEEFRAMIVAFVERTGFDGVPTLPAEARFTVAYARRLTPLVEY